MHGTHSSRAVVAGTCWKVTTVTVVKQLAEVLEQLGTPAVDAILAVLHHAIQVV